MKLGIDFGTTNSAVAAFRDGQPQILELVPGERVQRTVIHCSQEGVVSFGNAAFRAYQDQDLSGRFLRSLKAFLSQDVPRTTLGRNRYTFTELITAYMRFLIDGAERILDARVTDVVVGRPVRFHADPARDARAGDRLRQALDNAELNGCKLQLEPVAAAHSYERGLDSDRTVLVGDFGGGTADFAVLKVGPGRVGGDRLKDVLGTAGVAQAGDVLDGRFMETYLMPYFGRGTPLIPKYSTAEEPWQHPVHRKIQRLYDLHRLRTDDLQRRLEALEPRMVDTRPIRRLRRLVFDDLGYPLAWAIEHSKRTLSDTSHTTFAFGDFFIEELDIHHPVDVDSFAEGCQEQLSAYRKATLDAVRTAGLTPDRVDDIFLTGGTSQLPFIRGLYADLFGAERIATADAFTSVCAGLALS